MPRLRTALVTVAVGGALAVGGVVATTAATAAPSPVAAVSALRADDAATTADSDSSAPSDGVRHPGRHGARQWWKGLTDTQRQCLEDAEITRPVGPLDDVERQALRDRVTKAADACGVELPFPKARAFWDGLTDTQQQCLKDAAVERPWGPMTKEQRQQVRSDLEAAAQTCGVELPERPQHAQRPAPAPSATPSS